MKTYKETLDFIRLAHKDQIDKAGEQYWLHPYKVSQMVQGGETERIVALLHDVLEDTEYKVSDLRRMGYSEEIIRALICLTRLKGVTYSDYIRKQVMTNPISIRVKMADLTHNMDESRLPERLKHTEKFIERNKKYKKTYKMLKEYMIKTQVGILPTILGFTGIGGKQELLHITAIIVADYPNKGNKCVIKAVDIVKYGLTRFSNFTINLKGGEVTDFYISKNCFVKSEKNSPMTKYYSREMSLNTVKNNNTLVLCAKSNDYYWVSGVNFESKLLSKNQIANYINRGWVLVNGFLRNNGESYTVVPNVKLQDMPYTVKGLSERQYTALERKIDFDKVNGVKDSNDYEEYVPIIDKERVIAKELLELSDTLKQLDEIISAKDKSIILTIAGGTMVKKNIKDKFYKIYSRVCNIPKDDVIKRLEIPNELTQVKSFMDMLKDENILSIINDIKFYNTFDEEEHKTYNRFMTCADEITEEVQNITDELGLQLYGLKHRVKSPSSYCNKVRERCELVNKQEQLKSITDILRFTQVVSDLNNYGKTVNKSLDTFRNKGYKVLQVKNFWGDNMPYKGINCKIESPSGIRFEMQYHTPDFLLVKDAMHSWYEIRRTGTRKGTEKWNYVLRQELALSKTVRVPKDYSLVKEYKFGG